MRVNADDILDDCLFISFFPPPPYHVTNPKLLQILKNILFVDGSKKIIQSIIMKMRIVSFLPLFFSSVSRLRFSYSLCFASFTETRQEMSFF